MIYVLKAIWDESDHSYKAFSSYHTAHGIVVIADSETEARYLARRFHSERADRMMEHECDGWLDSMASTCELVNEADGPGLVLMDWSEG